MERLDLDLIHERIESEGDVLLLRALRDQCHEMFQRHLFSFTSRNWHHQLNLFHNHMIRKAIQISEQQMMDEGRGEPPVAYAFVCFGSGGRNEQTLWSDQDNGIILGPNEGNSATVEPYFAEFSKRIEFNLQTLGYPPCDGNVLCTNAQWRKSLDEWREMTYGWLGEPTWEHVRYLLILADIRCVYGHEVLVDQLKQTLLEYLSVHPEMLVHMLKNTLHHKVSLGVFGQLITERYGLDAGGVDIKYGAYIPMVNSVRLLAIAAGIEETSTLERLDRLGQMPEHSNNLMLDCTRAFEIILKLRSITPYQTEDGVYSSRGYLQLQGLNKQLRNELKFCLRIGNELQKYVMKKMHKVNEAQ